MTTTNYEGSLWYRKPTGHGTAAQRARARARAKRAKQTVRFDKNVQITFRNNKPISSTQYFDEASGTYKWK
jgi:hypothetical protein